MSMIDEAAPVDRYPDRDVGSAPHKAHELLTMLGLWAGTVIIAGFLALQGTHASYVDGGYVPVTNDSFYHAHRMLDTISGDGFYDFDQRLHVPEGTWVTWPYAYDYLVAKIAGLALWMSPDTAPMTVLAHVPVLWLAVNAALFLAAASALGLSLPMRALAMLAFALSPLTQILHFVGMLDHHYIEYTFVMLNLWLGLAWFRRGAEPGGAVALAVALGAAPAFHVGLFFLQIPVLACIFILWLRNEPPARRSLIAFAVTLTATSLLAALPSGPLRNGVFEFALLSWFHVYVAACTSALMAYMAMRRFSSGALTGLAILAAVLSLPVLAEIVRGSSFFTRGIAGLESIVETRSVLIMLTQTMGPLTTLSFYSGLLVIAPVLLVFYAWRVCREDDARRLFYALSVVMGIGLLLMQFRMHYYGQFVMVTGALVVVERLRARFDWRASMVTASVAALVLIAYYPAVTHRLFTSYPLAADPQYHQGRPLLLTLAELCAREPGIVLSNGDDGNPILFHTQCSVIANNFILRPQDEDKHAEVRRLMASTPAAVRAHRPGIRYVLLRARDFSAVANGRQQLVAGIPLADQLLASADPPAGFEHMGTLVDTSNGSVYARLFRIEPGVSDD